MESLYGGLDGLRVLFLSSQVEPHQAGAVKLVCSVELRVLRPGLSPVQPVLRHSEAGRGEGGLEVAQHHHHPSPVQPG